MMSLRDQLSARFPAESLKWRIARADKDGK